MATSDELLDAVSALIASRKGGNGHVPDAIAAQLDLPHEPGEPTSWEPADIAAVIAGGCTVNPPTLYARGDGACLFYPAKIHALNGEPESGKSWMAQHATVQALDAGHEVTYLDFEDSPEAVVDRLLALGAHQADLIARLTYLNPHLPLSEAANNILKNRFVTHRPALVVVDGITEAMSILGLDPLDNVHVARFFRILPRRLAGLGAAVVLVDHVVKDPDSRGRWAIGGQHKMAAISGAAYTIEAVKPFGRGVDGFAKATVTKDRPGWIRRHAAGTVIAELHITSADDHLVAELRAPDASGPAGFRPTAIMDRVMSVLAHGPSLTTNGLYAAVGGKRQHFQLALELLAADAKIATHKRGQATFYYISDQAPMADHQGGGLPFGRGDDNAGELYPEADEDPPF